MRGAHFPSRRHTLVQLIAHVLRPSNSASRDKEKRGRVQRPLPEHRDATSASPSEFTKKGSTICGKARVCIRCARRGERGRKNDMQRKEEKKERKGKERSAARVYKAAHAETALSYI